MFRYQGSDLYMQGGSTNDQKNIEFGLDLSELLNYVEPGVQAKYFLVIEESDSNSEGIGTINNYSVIDYTNGTNEYICSQTNVPLTNNNSTILSVEATVNFNDIIITTDTIPKATLNTPYNAQVQAQGGIQPYKWFPFNNYKITQVSNVLTPITGTVLSNTFQNAPLQFEFPFYGKKYTVGTATQKGALMFENEDPQVPYNRHEDLMLRYLKNIAPFYGIYNSNTIRYEGNTTYAKFYWTANFHGTELQYLVTLFVDGTIYIDYGNCPTPSIKKWQAGVSMGDQISYQEFSFSGMTFPANTRIILEPQPFPKGLGIDNNGIISGTLTEEFPGDSIFVKVIDNNWLENIKGFLFTNRGLLFSNYNLTSPDNNIPEYGENVQMSLRLTNVGEASINNIQLVLEDVDPNYSLVDSLAFLSNLQLNQSGNLDTVFEFSVNEQIADNTLITFVINATSDELQASDTVSFIVRAPNIQIINTVYTDLNDNIFDPGETGTINIHYKNTGGSPAYNLISEYLPQDSYLTINAVSGNTKALLLPDSTWIVILNITSDPATPYGYVSTVNSEINGDRSYTKTQNVLIGIGLIIENWETGGISSFPWGLAGNAQWYIDNTIHYGGNYSLHSGLITHDQVSVLKLVGTVSTAGSLSFYKKVSSEASYDFLCFYIDSVKVAEWSGEQDWSIHVFQMNSGFHSFEWKYEKDGSVNSGSDAAWVDNIIFPPMDFASPELLVSTDHYEKTMVQNILDTDTIYVTNTGGGLLTYQANIDNASVSRKAQGAQEQRSVDGSTLTASPSAINTGVPVALNFSLYNGSTDSEWLKDVTVSFPLGVTLDSATSFIGGTGGPMAWSGVHGNGSDVNWHGEDGSGWGVVRGNETATAVLYLQIDSAIQNSIVLLYQIDGDIYGATPHSISDVIILTNNGPNSTWLTLSSESGNLTSNQSSPLFLNFNTYGIALGTYYCNINIFSATDTASVAIELNVTDFTDIIEIRNSLTLHPNPADTYFQVNIPSCKKINAEIFTMTGQCIAKKIADGSIINYNTSQLPDGVYILVITCDNTRWVEKIIVAH